MSRRRTRIRPRRRRERPIKTSVKSGNFRPTRKGAGMTRKGVMAYRLVLNYKLLLQVK